MLSVGWRLWLSLCLWVEEKLIRNGTLKNLRTAVRTLSTYIDRFEKTKAKEAAKSLRNKRGAAEELRQDEDTPVALPPVSEALGSLSKEEDFSPLNIKPHLGSEFFDNSCAVMLNISGLEDLAKTIAAMPYYDRHDKWIMQHLSMEASTYACARIMKPAVQDSVNTALRGALPADAFVRLSFPMSSREWSDNIFSTQFFCAKTGHFGVHMPPFCVREARFLFEGTEMVAGIQLERLPQGDLSMKMNSLESSSKDDILKLVKDGGGFIVRHTAPHVLCVPLGHLLVTLVDGAESVKGLRWGMFNEKANEEFNLVCTSLAETIRILPDHANGEYAQWKKYLMIHSSST